MNKSIIFILLVTFFCCETIPEKKYKYYANLTGVVSPYLEYTPQGEVTKKEANDLGHYYIFSYEGSRISEIVFFKRNQPSSQSYFQTHKVAYHYYKDSYTRSYYDEHGNKTNMWRHYYQGGDIHQEEYAWNEKGKKTSLILRDSAGKQISSGDGVYKYIWNHLNDNEVIQEHYDSVGKPTNFRKDIPFERLRLKIDDRGYSSSVTRIGKDNNSENHPTEGYATLKLHFDDYGNETGWEHRNEKMEKVNLPNEFAHSQWLYQKNYRNQKLGIVSSFDESYYDKDGLRVQNEDSIHQIRYELNDYGEIIGLSYYNSELKEQNHLSRGFSRAEIAYDSLGNRISVSKYDVKGKAVE